MDLEVWHIALAALYLTVAALCLAETVKENRNGPHPPDIWYGLGLVLCVFWPVLVVLLLARCLYDLARRQRC